MSSLLLIMFAQALAATLQQTALGLQGVVFIQSKPLADALMQCQGVIAWLGGQLQQLLLPGEQRKAAAALRDLQEQQHQLQQALLVALSQLNETAEQAQPQPQQQHVSSSNSRSSGDNSMQQQQQQYPDTDIDLLESREPAEPISELPGLLLNFGEALWSALPQPRCCNNAACTNLDSVSDAKLVAGKASRCSKCKVAK
jgi:hypothetical protein